MSSQSLRPGPVEGVGVRLPPPRMQKLETSSRPMGLLWNTHPVGMSSRSLIEEVNPVRSQHPQGKGAGPPGKWERHSLDVKGDK